MTSPLEAPASGRRWGWMESSYAEPTAAKRYVATDVKCPECGSGPGVACPGERVHGGRIQECLRMARSGLLPEAPPDERVTPEECSDCGREVTHRGKPKACSDAHRCRRILPTKHRCTGVVLPGSGMCAAHVGLESATWNGAVAPSAAQATHLIET